MTYNYGTKFNLPTKATEANMSAWDYYNFLFVGWEYNGKQYDQADEFYLDITRDLTDEDLTYRTVKIYSVWQPTDVDVKIYLNGGSYIGTNQKYLSSIGSDERGSFIIIENQTYNEAFALIDFDELYRFGYFTNSYYNLARYNYIYEESILLTASVLDGYELIVQVVWTEANVYIKDYYGTNYHKFFNNFETAVGATRENDEVVLLTNTVSLTDTVVIDKNLTFSVDPDLRSDVTIRRDNAFQGANGYMFTVATGKTLTFAENQYGSLIVNGAYDAATGVAINNIGGNVVISSGVMVTGNTNSLNNFGGAIYVQDGTLTVNGGVISNNKVEASIANGGAIYATNSVVTINSGNILNNSVVSTTGNASAGAIFVINSTLNIYGATISNNTSTAAEGKIAFGGADSHNAST